MAVRAQIIATAVAIAVVGSVAVAQVRQVQMGTALDANPQVGSGGTNKPVAGFVPLNGNEVMSGNVSGLKYFHGNSATISPYSFQGRLGSSSLGGFARQSAGNDINPTPLNQSFYLPSATVSTSQGNLYSAPIGSGFDSQLVPRAAISPLASPQAIRSLQPTNAADNTDKVGLNKASIGAGTEPEPGQQGAVLSSPLFALRIPDKQEVSFGGNQPQIDRGTGTQESNANQDQTPPKPKGILGELNPGRQETRQESVPGRIESRIDARIGGTYLDLLDNLKKAEAEAAKGENAPQGVVPVKVVVPDYLSDQIDPLTGLPRRVTLKQNAGGTTTAPALGGIKGSAVAVSPQRLQDLPQSTLQAGSHVRPITSFVTKPTVGEASTTVDTLLAKAEDSMKRGRYLEAAQTYQSVVTRDPNNPLAVVGRAHAELGAGMYQSAAFDLKFVFTRHPTMVAVHYDINSFIGETRRDYLVRDLATLAGNKDTANTANFLLCYFDYQTDKPRELQAQLQKWQDMAEHDTWPSVLTRAWTGNKPPQDVAQ